MEKLLQVVLQWRSCQQQFVLQRVVVQDPEKLREEPHVNFSSSCLHPDVSHRYGPVSTLDWLFFSRWASSTTRQAQSMEPRIAMSMVISS